MKLPPSIKKNVARILLPGVSPILCASISRVGSTMVQHALSYERSKVRLGPLRSLPRSFVREAAWELKDTRFRPGAIYVTHDLPYDLVATPELKVIFLFGRPSDTVLSLVRRYRQRGPDWMRRHFAHMHAIGPYKELIQRDVIRIGEQITAWQAVRNANVLGLRYSALWENTEILSEFVGFKVTLPGKIDRTFLDIDPAISAMVRHNYRELDLEEARLSDHFFTLKAGVAQNDNRAAKAECRG
jgi:hypothetical protein